jgi:hypothetical protein
MDIRVTYPPQKHSEGRLDVRERGYRKLRDQDFECMSCVVFWAVTTFTSPDVSVESQRRNRQKSPSASLWFGLFCDPGDRGDISLRRRLIKFITAAMTTSNPTGIFMTFWHRQIPKYKLRSAGHVAHTGKMHFCHKTEIEDALNISHHVTSMFRLLINNELLGMWKETIVT